MNRALKRYSFHYTQGFFLIVPNCIITTAFTMRIETVVQRYGGMGGAATSKYAQQ
jgi:hypothetical protein